METLGRRKRRKEGQWQGFKNFVLVSSSMLMISYREFDLIASNSAFLLC